MTTTQKLDWQLEFELDAPRYVRASAEDVTYCAVIPDAVTLRDAIIEFSSTYDYNGSTEQVDCSAMLLVDGNEAESVDASFSAESDEIEFENEWTAA